MSVAFREFLRRLAHLFAPAVRLHVWEHSRDRRTNAQRDRELERAWRENVRANERRREMARQRQRATVGIPFRAGETLQVFAVDTEARVPVAVPPTNFLRRQAD